MPGITPDGFDLATIADIKADIEAEELAEIDAGLNTSASKPLGQFNGIISRKLAELWELAQVAYGAFDREAAEGRLLDNLGGITGTTRKPASKSFVTCTCNFNASFSASAGTLFANVSGQDARWTNRDAIPSAGAGDRNIVFEAIDYGPVAANAGTLEVISAPVTGWNSITNALDAVLGRLEETDAEYRQRQVDELTAAGSSTVDAIRADVLKVAGVEQCFVFENTTLTTDGDGVPGKAIEVVVYDGPVPAADDDEIAQAIWDSKASGVETYGGESGTAVDSLGDNRTIYFSRATVQNVYLEFDVRADSNEFPSNGVALIKAAAAAQGNTLNFGHDVIALAIRATALEIPGVIDVTALRLGLTVSPVGTANLTVGSRAIARFDTTRISVSLV